MIDERSRSSQPEQLLTEEEWASWKDHPTTKMVWQYFRAKQEECKRNWMDGKFTHPTVEGTAQLNAKALGICGALADILDLDHNAINGEINE